MALACFTPKRFRPESLDLIEQADTICRNYAAQGFTLTLRQLYYQFVARGLLANKQASYDKLGSVINDARLAGLLDWDWIEDRTRNLRTSPSWNTPQDILQACADTFQTDPWKAQKIRCEVWVEKDALTGVIEPACNDLRVPYFACRGYTSQSETYAAARRFVMYARAGQGSMIFHLGDHDPSGIDMTRDNEARIRLMMGERARFFRIVRLALNMDQVEEHSPPPNPAKMTDSRATGYVERFGDESWELDALDPATLDGLIRDSVKELIDAKAWKKSMAYEAEQRERLSQVALNYKE